MSRRPRVIQGAARVRPCRRTATDSSRQGSEASSAPAHGFAPMNINEIGTPALVVDSGLFQENISRMATEARAHKKRLRPHFKAHKCLEVARRQAEAGAAGICAATEREAQVLVRGGIRNVLVTSPIADGLKARRLAALV